MTPIELELMLHCYYSVEDHPHRHTASFSNALQRLMVLDLIFLGTTFVGFNPTKKGVKFVEMLCDTPRPVEVTHWIDPRKEVK